ncbi:MAG: ABC transporter permease [Proteobacteria bacterium]|nr:ABC transporter permease [Pseudomonadota bacterium]
MNTSAKKIVYYFISGTLILSVFISYFFNAPVTIAVLSSAIRQSTPLVLGAMCGLIGERAGVINIGIEGQMLFGAFTGFIVSIWTGNLFLAVCAGMVSGLLLGLFLGFMAVSLHVDQIIAGTVINIAAVGVCGYFYPTGLSVSNKLQAMSIPFLSDIPLIGPLFFSNSPITMVTILLVFFLQFMLFRSTWGLRTRASGEHPEAAETLGLNVYTIRYSRLMAGGALAGLAGVFLSLEAVGTFERNMVNGRGFIALAVMIFGRWTPIGSWGAALLFALTSALQTQLQFSDTLHIPHQFTGMLPYLMTVFVIAVFMKRNNPPEALGMPFEKD